MPESTRECTVDGCHKARKGRVYCDMHYYRWRVNGDPLVTKQTKHFPGQTCSEPGCDRPVRKRNLCSSHYTSAWREEHPEKAHAAITNSWRKRGARRRAAIDIAGSHSEEEWQHLRKSVGGKCIYCLDAEGDTRDHVVPLSRGGTDDIGNIVPACRPCNMSKHNLLIQEWIRSGRPGVPLRLVQEFSASS